MNGRRNFFIVISTLLAIFLWLVFIIIDRAELERAKIEQFVLTFDLIKAEDWRPVPQGMVERVNLYNSEIHKKQQARKNKIRRIFIDQMWDNMTPVNIVPKWQVDGTPRQ